MITGWPVHANGFLVRTATELDGRDYTAEARAQRKPGVGGKILGHSDSHGICYQVEHDDGSTAYYDPGELLSEDGRPLSDDYIVRDVMTA